MLDFMLSEKRTVSILKKDHETVTAGSREDCL
jgi:hypothetical protein